MHSPREKQLNISLTKVHKSYLTLLNRAYKLTYKRVFNEALDIFLADKEAIEGLTPIRGGNKHRHERLSIRIGIRRHRRLKQLSIAKGCSINALLEHVLNYYFSLPQIEKSLRLSLTLFPSLVSYLESGNKLL